MRYLILIFFILLCGCSGPEPEKEFCYYKEDATLEECEKAIRECNYEAERDGFYTYISGDFEGIHTHEGSRSGELMDYCMAARGFDVFYLPEHDMLRKKVVVGYWALEGRKARSK